MVEHAGIVCIRSITKEEWQHLANLIRNESDVKKNFLCLSNNARKFLILLVPRSLRNSTNSLATLASAQMPRMPPRYSRRWCPMFWVGTTWISLQLTTRRSTWPRHFTSDVATTRTAWAWLGRIRIGTSSSTRALTSSCASVAFWWRLAGPAVITSSSHQPAPRPMSNPTGTSRRTVASWTCRWLPCAGIQIRWLYSCHMESSVAALLVPVELSWPRKCRYRCHPNNVDADPWGVFLTGTLWSTTKLHSLEIKARTSSALSVPYHHQTRTYQKLAL